MKTPRFQLAHRGSIQNQRHNSPRFAPPYCSIRTLVPLAVGAALVGLELDQALQRRAVLLGAISRGIRPPRHGVSRKGGVECVVCGRSAVQAAGLSHRSQCLGELSAVWYEAAAKTEGRRRRRYQVGGGCAVLLSCGVLGSSPTVPNQYHVRLPSCHVL